MAGIQPRLVVIGLQGQTIQVLTASWPDHPSQAELMELPNLELILALKINGQQATLTMNKTDLAHELSEFLATVDHSPFPGGPPVRQQQLCQNPCMVCQTANFEFIFVLCSHLGICAGCRETLLAQDPDPRHRGNNRMAECPICKQQQPGQFIRRVQMVDFALD